MRHFFGMVRLIFGGIAISAVLGSAQSLWVGASTGANAFNFSPTFFNNELTNLGSPNQLALYDHSGSDSFQQLNLILAFANVPASVSITGVKAYSNVGNVNGSNNISAGSGTFTATSIGAFASATFTSANSNAYTALGLSASSGGAPSENFGNYSGAEASIGITATKFYLYEYNLSSFAANFGGYGLLDLTFNGTLPLGAVAIGWGCGSTSGCSPQYNSVFTQSGFAGGGGSTSSVPEPSSIILLGSVFLAILGIWQRKNKNKLVA